MSPLTLAQIREVKSRLSSIVSTPISSSIYKAGIDAELKPILEELVLLGYQYYSRKQHPTFKKLFDWLMQPHRTAEDFIYVLRPLVQNIYNIYNGPLMYMGMTVLKAKGYMLYVGVAALEALAMKCPVLEDNWENTVWLVMQIIYHVPGGPITPSERLSTWIINMIGDADICPNSYLRIQLMYLLGKNIVKINAHNRPQALEAVMSACSYLNIHCLDREDNDKYHNCSYINFQFIVEIVRLTKNDLPEFSETLAKKLSYVNSTQLRSMVYDATNRCGLNPNNCKDPKELISLVALLNTTSEYAKYEFDYMEGQMYRYDEMERHMFTYYLMNMVKMLVKNFKSCFSMPQLTYPTALLVINVMEFIIRNELYPYSPAFENEQDQYIPEMDDSNVIEMDKLLQELLVKDPQIGKEVVFRYSKRLKILSEHFENLDAYHAVSNLMTQV